MLLESYLKSINSQSSSLNFKRKISVTNFSELIKKKREAKKK